MQKPYGSVGSEARGHLKSVNLHKHGGKHESVAAGCVFVALRSHGHSVSLKGFADRLGLDASGINRVVTDLRKDAGVIVEPKAPADVQGCLVFLSLSFRINFRKYKINTEMRERVKSVFHLETKATLLLLYSKWLWMS